MFSTYGTVQNVATQIREEGSNKLDQGDGLGELLALLNSGVDIYLAEIASCS